MRVGLQLETEGHGGKRLCRRLAILPTGHPPRPDLRYGLCEAWDELFEAAGGGARSLEQLGVQFGAALALAGDAVQAQTLAKDLGKRSPEDTVVQFNYLPTLHAQLALSHNDSSKAIEALQAAGPYELGNVVGDTLLYPVYVHG
jgi:eukaryotic-like serine/threonine-protein kinase